MSDNRLAQANRFDVSVQDMMIVTLTHMSSQMNTAIYKQISHEAQFSCVCVCVCGCVYVCAYMCVPSNFPSLQPPVLLNL